LAVIFHDFGWYIQQSSTGTVVPATSLLGCQGWAAPADYSGDGYADPAVYCEHGDTLGTYRYVKSQSGQELGFQWGAGYLNDFPVPDDYDNDGHTDFAVYRNGDWWIYSSNTQQPAVFHFGQSGDVPAQNANLVNTY
jgi:hypothetical protein